MTPKRYERMRLENPHLNLSEWKDISRTHRQRARRYNVEQLYLKRCTALLTWTYCESIKS